MSRGHGKLELLILYTIEAWSPFPLTELLRGEYTKDKAKALKRAARSLEDKGEIDIAYDKQGRLLVKKPAPREWPCRAKWIGERAFEPNPGAPEPEPGQRWMIERTNGMFDVIKITGTKLHRGHLSLDDANRLANIPTRGRAPEWGEREADLDRQHDLGRTADTTRGWRHDDPLEPGWEDALFQKAVRMVADREDYLETLKRNAREQALRDSIEDDRRRGQKWKKSRNRGDEDDLDAEREHLPNEEGRRAVDAADAIAAVDGQDDTNRLLKEPAGTLEQSEEDRERQDQAEQAQTAQESYEAVTEDEWTDEEPERLASLKRPVDDPDDDFEPDPRTRTRTRTSR